MPKQQENNGLVLGLVAAGGFLAYKLARRAGMLPPAPGETPQSVTKIRIDVPNVRFKGDNVEFDLYVKNPNSNPVTIGRITGDVFISYNGKTVKLGSVVKPGPVTLQPQQGNNFPFSIRLKLIPLVVYFNDILEGKAKGQIAVLRGIITVNGRPVPFTEKVKLILR